MRPSVDHQLIVASLFPDRMELEPTLDGGMRPSSPSGSTTLSADSTSIDGKGKSKETPAEALTRFRGNLRMSYNGKKKIFEPGQNGPKMRATNDDYHIQRRKSAHPIKARVSSTEEDSPKYRQLKGAYNGLQARFITMEDVLNGYAKECEELNNSVRVLEDAVDETLKAYQNYARNYGPGVNVSWDGEVITICCQQQRSRSPSPSPSPSPPLSLSPLPLPPSDSDDAADRWLDKVAKHLPALRRTPTPPLNPPPAPPSRSIPPTTGSPPAPTHLPPSLPFPPSPKPTTSICPTQASIPFPQVARPPWASIATSQTPPPLMRRSPSAGKDADTNASPGKEEEEGMGVHAQEFWGGSLRFKVNVPFFGGNGAEDRDTCRHNLLFSYFQILSLSNFPLGIYMYNAG
ncbi:MAG: hypothetical protein M1840_003143 [Geoglossum simile]|nr:MAG: hypothetical protein M1840_003143 [Geoglossum simile]